MTGQGVKERYQYRDTTGIVAERAATHGRLGPHRLTVLHRQLGRGPQLLVDGLSTRI
jgi:hypothetical protein